MSGLDRQDTGATRSARTVGWLERLGRNAAYRMVSRLLHDFEWVHLGIGILGNLAFFIGSILFLWRSLQTAGTWLFIVGAGGMLIGSLGSAAVKLERRRLRETGRDEPRR